MNVKYFVVRDGDKIEEVTRLFSKEIEWWGEYLDDGGTWVKDPRAGSYLTDFEHFEPIGKLEAQQIVRHLGWTL